MKKFLASFLLALLTACQSACFAQADLDKDPAYLPIDKALDLKAIPPQVNVNLPRFLIKDAISALNSSDFGKKTDLSDLVKEVKLIRVVAFDAEKNNQAALDKGMKALQEMLDAKWTSIVSIPEENVRVYAIGDASGESMAGIALLIQDGENAVVANIVGHVSLEKLVKIASESGLPKELLKKWSGVAEKSTTAAVPEKDTKSSGVTTNTPSAPPAGAAKDSAAK